MEPGTGFKPKLDRSTWREYLLLDGGVGMVRPDEPALDGRGEPVDGVNWLSSPPKESCHQESAKGERPRHARPALVVFPHSPGCVSSRWRRLWSAAS